VTTANDLVARTRRELLSGYRDQRNKLEIAINPTATTIRLMYPFGAVNSGATLTIGLEEFGVWTVSPGTRTAIVERGESGTAAVAHKANDLVLINPVAPPHLVFDAINADIAALPGSGLYRMRTIELAAASTALTYDLNVSDCIDVYDITWDETDATRAWPHLREGWQVRRAPSAFGGRVQLRLHEQVTPGRPIRVLYKARFAALTSLDDDVESVTGMPESMVDIVSLGAQVRLMGTREAKRTFTESQPDTRRAGEVPVGSAMRSAASVMQLRQQRIGAERALLDAAYPYRRPA
jgi:hypothetical protein